MAIRVKRTQCGKRPGVDPEGRKNLRRESASPVESGLVTNLAEVERAVRDWREERCAAACPQCPINCCKGRLNPRLENLDAFPDLPVVRRASDPRPANGGSYVADRRFLWWGGRLLVGQCPHLRDSRCTIHEHSARPRDCCEYPMHVQGFAGSPIINIENSCWIFGQPEHRQAAEELARTLGVPCVFHGQEASV